MIRLRNAARPHKFTNYARTYIEKCVGRESVLAPKTEPSSELLIQVDCVQEPLSGNRLLFRSKKLENLLYAARTLTLYQLCGVGLDRKM